MPEKIPGGSKLDVLWLQKQFDEVNRNISIAISRIGDVEERVGAVLTQIKSLDSKVSNQFLVVNKKLDKLLETHAKTLGITFDEPTQK